MPLARIRQEEDEEEEARRRRRYPKPAPPMPALAIIVPARRERARRRFFTCRCLDGSMIELEEGERCPPGCNPITQGEGFPFAPVVFTLGLLGGLGYLVAKRPFR